MRTITDSFNVTKVNMLVELYTTTGGGGGNAQVTSAQTKKFDVFLLQHSCLFCLLTNIRYIFALKILHHTSYSSYFHPSSLLATQTCITPLSLFLLCSQHYPALIYK